MKTQHQQQNAFLITKNVEGKNFLGLSGGEKRKASQSQLKMLIIVIIVLRGKQAILGFSELPDTTSSHGLSRGK